MNEFRTDAGSAGRRHPDMTPELRQLAQAILERLDPAVKAAAARATSGGEGRCQQTWCPVCALAALVTGEQHPLLTVIAEHSVALLAVVRAMVDAMDTGRGSGTDTGEPPGPADPRPDGPAPDDDPPPSGPGRYEHIPITVEE
jgi:hypothetical protein